MLDSPDRTVQGVDRTNELDFSVILAVRVPNSNQYFRLRRYNGDSHQHTNTIESQTLRGCHIHHATERYQQIGAKEDAYAATTDRYSSCEDAMECLIRDANLVVPNAPDDRLGPLFDRKERRDAE